MRIHLSKLTVVMLTGLLLMVSGCGGGGGGDALPATATTQVNSLPAGSVAMSGGSLTVAAGYTVTANPAGSTVNAIIVPAGVTIVPPAGAGFTTATTIEITTFSGVSGMPDPLTPGFKVDAMAGAVDVKIGGLNGITFTGGQATINIPITGTVTSCQVFVNKNDGNGYVPLGPGTCSNGVATINVSNLCTFVIDPHFSSSTTGSTGGTGSSGF